MNDKPWCKANATIACHWTKIDPCTHPANIAGGSAVLDSVIAILPINGPHYTVHSACVWHWLYKILFYSVIMILLYVCTISHEWHTPMFMFITDMNIFTVLYHIIKFNASLNVALQFIINVYVPAQYTP